MHRPEILLRRSHELLFTRLDPSSFERHDVFSSKVESEECPIACAGELCTTAIATKHTTGLYNFTPEGFSALGQIPEEGVVHTLVSPNGKYLVTQVAVKESQPANVAVWDISTLSLIKRFQQHSWPVFAWSTDCETCLRLTTNAVIVLEGEMHTAKQIGKIPVRPVKGKEYISEMRRNTLVLIQPSDRDCEGSIQLFSRDDLSAPCNVFPHTTLDGADILWAPDDLHAIIITRVDTDRSNQSYYGTRGVILVDCQRKKMRHIKLGEGSSPHDISWSPNGKEFIIIYGRMPHNVATIYSAAGAPLFEFSSAPRNVVAWAPDGRTIALGGSGSLNGEFVFWDRENLENPLKANGRMGGIVMKGSTYAWSPCSRYFLCAVLASRMQVGNCVAIFARDGQRVANIQMDQLLEACWVPYNPKIYADIPFRPKYQSANQISEQPKLFVPKHRSAEAAKFLQRNDSTDGVRRVVKPSQKISSVIPGAVVAAPRRNPSPVGSRRPPEARDKQVQAESVPEMNQKIRSLSKKLREIVVLQESTSVSLTSDQLKKIEKKPSIESEIERLSELVRNNSSEK
ncbi:hypothetical protein XU18_0954 [Perkinsela sp. CCAP 1560/4]|nr:hypothetical protein XU18_4694 [Perkinsela sp. CCAP 1560/4]KNH08551.1 hypothetical protein XU18_0954 [Perkinsela sp. CCAP 1560/4]|eukprot:KNH04024.1 hypothetical protein XU18_4694 [Perkinsela sp. CCAP 1560/4]